MWKPESELYKQLQLLIEFADFVAAQKECSYVQTDLEQIKKCIRNMNKPDLVRGQSFFVDISIYEINMEAIENGAISMRSWSVELDLDMLDIQIESRSILEDIGHYGDDFWFYGTVYFDKELKGGERVYLEKNIQSFLGDAKKFRTYIHDTFREVDIDLMYG